MILKFKIEYWLLSRAYTQKKKKSCNLIQSEVVKWETVANEGKGATRFVCSTLFHSIFRCVEKLLYRTVHSYKIYPWITSPEKVMINLDHITLNSREKSYFICFICSFRSMSLVSIFDLHIFWASLPCFVWTIHHPITQL